MEEIHLSQRLEDLKKEVALQELDTAGRGGKAMGATLEWARDTAVATQMTNSIAENEVKQKADESRRDVAAAVQQWAATATLVAAEVLKNGQIDTSMQHDGIVDEDPGIVPGGTKCTWIERSPCRGNMGHQHRMHQ